MRLRKKHIPWLVLAAFTAIAMWFGYREYDERRMIREEEALRDLDVGPFMVEDATLEAALRLVVQQVHAHRHPEVRLRRYSDARQVPYFHAEINRLSSPVERPAPTFSLRLGQGEPLPLWVLLRYVGGLNGCTCDFRGHDLIVVPAIGTMERFRRRTYRLAPLFQYNDKGVLRWFESSGYTLKYEGMTMKVNPKKSQLVIVGPDSAAIDIFPGEIADVPLTDRVRYFLLDWRSRLLGF